MGKLPDPMPKRARGRTPSVPLEPPPAPPRYVGGTWRPGSPGWGDRPGEADTRPLPKQARKRSA